MKFMMKNGKNKIYDFEQLSLWCCHFFLKQDRRMRISLAVRKFDVDVPRLKFDQNRPTGTQDKCHLIESQNCQNAFLILNSVCLHFLPSIASCIILVTSHRFEASIHWPRAVLQPSRVPVWPSRSLIWPSIGPILPSRCFKRPSRPPLLARAPQGSRYPNLLRAQIPCQNYIKTLT